jgi:A nuclease of the HNH/ENDO VII superfamily with conserved WHH/SMI1 / KNR4 family (SUKH-1)
VRLSDPLPGLSMDEVRVVDVLTANAATATVGDALWDVPGVDVAARTPPGWVWAHLFGTRQMALVPAEARGAFRYLGGVATLPIDRSRRGVRIEEHSPVPVTSAQRLPERLVQRLEERLGQPLPAAYRAFLAATNGATPTAAGIHPGFGFVVDQPLFGLGRTDRHQDLVYANEWFGDRLTREFLAIGYVQGGLLAVKVTGADAGSVWYLDDDDYRDDDSFTAPDISSRLLARCADDVDQFWAALSQPPPRLRRVVRQAVRSGWVVSARPKHMGASLPPNRRPPLDQRPG